MLSTRRRGATGVLPVKINAGQRATPRGLPERRGLIIYLKKGFGFPARKKTEPLRLRLSIIEMYSLTLILLKIAR